MDTELYRLVTDPGLGLKNWNIEAALKFVEIIKSIMEIQTMIDKHGLTTRSKSKYGVHYKECVWSRTSVGCGPDTCVCCVINLNRYNITRLLNEIGSIVKPHQSRCRSVNS